MKVLFFINRYLPFVSAFFGLDSTGSFDNHLIDFTLLIACSVRYGFSVLSKPYYRKTVKD